MKILTKGQYYGSRHTESIYNGFVVSHYDYTEIKTDWHCHENPYFMYVLDGNMKSITKRGESLCPPGSLMYTNWHELHYGSKHTRDASGFHIEFEIDWLKKLEVYGQMEQGSQKLEYPDLHIAATKIFHEYVLADKYAEVSIQLMILQICELLSNNRERSSEADPIWVDRLRELLHFDSSDITLDYLSQQLGIHPVHISRTATKYLGMSLGEYVRKLKLSKALPHLIKGDKTLTEVSYLAGFADQSHFNRVFKSQFDINPKKYRKLIKNILC